MPPFTCHIEKKRSYFSSCLVIRVLGQPQDELEKEIGQFLKKYQQQDLFFIPHQQVNHFLTLMLRTGILHLEGRQIVVNLYSSVSLTYRVACNQKQQIHVSGWITDQKSGSPLHESDFICGGTPHFLIKGCVLKGINPLLSWKDLKNLFNRTVEFEEIAEDVPVEYLGHAKEVIRVSKEPLPVLKLSDRTGAFANLWLDYGKGCLVEFYDPRQSIDQIRRNKEVERGWQRDLLESGFSEKTVGKTRYYCPTERVVDSLTFLVELGWQVLDCQENRVLCERQITLQVTEGKAAVGIKGSITYAEYEADVRTALAAWQRGEHFVTLDHGQGVVGLLSEKMVNTTLKPLQEAAETEGDVFCVPKRKLAGVADLLEAHIPQGTPLKELIHNLKGTNTIALAPASQRFLGCLRPYQQQGVNWLNFLYKNGFHGILADEMGLGKTVQVLAFLSRLRSKRSILIVVPTSLLFNWRRECERFIPSFTLSIYYGKDREKLFELWQDPQIILTSYAILRSDISLLSQKEYQCVIVDEGQMIKNAHTQTAKAVFQLRAHFRLTLTGTPIENDLMELWTHFRFLMPGLLGDEATFKAQCTVASSDEQLRRHIKRRIRPFLLKRTKQRVAPDLPEKIEQMIWVEMDEEQRRLYDQCLQKARDQLGQRGAARSQGSDRMEILKAILRLRQICCHPLLCCSEFPEQTHFCSAKFDLILQDLQILVSEGHKVLVYSQFTQLLTLLSQQIKQLNCPFLYLDGSTKDREGLVQRFQSDPEALLFLISLKAGGVGLNLTAADYVMIIDPWWNDAVERQAIDRAHRIGRKKSVIAKRYITLDSIEEKILKLKQYKTTLAESLIASDDCTDDRIPIEDLLALIL